MQEGGISAMFTGTCWDFYYKALISSTGVEVRKALTLCSSLFHQHLALNRRWSPFGISHWFQTQTHVQLQSAFPGITGGGQPGVSWRSPWVLGECFCRLIHQDSRTLFSHSKLFWNLWYPISLRLLFCFIPQTVLWWTNLKVKSCHYVVQLFLRKKGKKQQTETSKA